MITSSRRTRNELLLLVVAISLCCGVRAEIDAGTQQETNAALSLQDFLDYEEDRYNALDAITTESVLPELTSLGVQENQKSFLELLQDFEDIEDRKVRSLRGERGLQPKLSKAEERANAAKEERAQQVVMAKKAGKKGDQVADQGEVLIIAEVNADPNAAKKVKKAKKNKKKGKFIAPQPSPAGPSAPTNQGNRRTLKKLDAFI